jgi:Bacterial regulatory proteins, luxR family
VSRDRQHNHVGEVDDIRDGRCDKTIESHLRNVFVKLGASSRVEVARTVERSRDEHD